MYTPDVPPNPLKAIVEELSGPALEKNVEILPSSWSTKSMLTSSAVGLRQPQRNVRFLKDYFTSKMWGLFCDVKHHAANPSPYSAAHEIWDPLILLNSRKANQHSNPDHTDTERSIDSVMGVWWSKFLLHVSSHSARTDRSDTKIRTLVVVRAPTRVGSLWRTPSLSPWNNEYNSGWEWSMISWF